MATTITVDGKEYIFDIDDLSNKEAMDIEKVTGMPFGKFTTSMEDGSAVAMTAIVWVLIKREQPGLRFGDVDFKFTDIKTDDEDEAEQEATTEENPTQETTATAE